MFDKLKEWFKSFSKKDKGPKKRDRRAYYQANKIRIRNQQAGYYRRNSDKILFKLKQKRAREKLLSS